MRALAQWSLATALMCIASPAFACSVLGGTTFSAEFAKAKLVFRGLATGTKLNSYALPSEGTSEPEAIAGDVKRRIFVDVTYELLETFKGEPDLNGTVTTTSMVMGGCGVQIVPGWQVLFVVMDRELPQEIAKSSQGTIYDFSSGMLPDNPDHLDEALAEVRAQAGKK